MAHRKYDQLTFAEKFIGPGRSKSDKFFDAINRTVDWKPFEEKLSVIHSSPMGRPATTPILLFKTLLIERFYNLGDVATEDALNDRKSFARFVGLPLDERAPDHSSISRFRSELIGRGLMDELIAALMGQIEAKGLILKQGTLMDATFIVSAARRPSAPRKPKAKPADMPAQAPAAAQDVDPFAAGKRSRRDPDGRWGKKGHKAHFGYKLHIAVDDERRIIRAHQVTPANVNDCEVGPELVQTDGGAHYGDKGYPSQPLRDKLAAHGLADGIMQLGTKHYPLSPAARRRNKLLSGLRAKVEGVFGEAKCRLGLARARYLGLAKVKLECALVVFAFNLKTMALAPRTT